MPVSTGTVFDSLISAVRQSIVAVSRFPKLVILGRLFALFLIIGGLAMIQATPASAAKYAAIVIEENSGRVLFARNADQARFPASLTKIMTLYLLFEELEARRLTMDTKMRVSHTAAGRSPSKLYLKAGQTVTVRDAIYALITKSANDVATVVAEHLSGTEREFGKRMTRKAHALSMNRTTFRNASGLPHSKQKSTARDMARLGIAIRQDFPQYFGFFSTKTFRWKGKRFGNHNKLLSKYNGTDGIKTGYINASGFNLVATVERHGVRLVGVVFGGQTGKSRDAHMVQILDKSFNRAKSADIHTQLADTRSRTRVAPKSLPTPLTAPGTLPVMPPPRSKRTGSIDVALGGEAAYLDGDDPAAQINAATPTRWSVQVGSFARRVNAHKAAATARRSARSVLGAIPARLTMVTRGNIPLWRVRFNNLDETQARTACAVLFAEGRPCVAIAETG